jgi:2-oxoglutarate ferredoxin oxidoreductase subunit delta
MTTSSTATSGPASGPTSGVVKSRGTVTIERDRCKGCELCIPACPPQVLTMSSAVNRMGFAYPQLHPGCTGCAACLLVCPDFVFEVFRFDTPVEHWIDGAAAGAGAAAGGDA